MSRFLLLPALAALTLVAPAASPPAQLVPAGPPMSAEDAACTQAFAREPLLVVDWTGTGPLGLMHMHLAVYDGGTTGAGLASISRAVGTSGTGTPPCSNQASVKTLAHATAAALRDQLRRAGAFEACDDPAAIPDVPLRTFTVFSEAPGAPSHTFSHWTAQSPEAQATEQVVGAFVAAQFPGYGY